jgi:hypothetical protein
MYKCRIVICHACFLVQVANGLLTGGNKMNNFKQTENLKTKFITFKNPRTHLINIKSTGTNFGFNPYF